MSNVYESVKDLLEEFKRLEGKTATDWFSLDDVCAELEEHLIELPRIYAFFPSRFEVEFATTGDIEDILVGLVDGNKLEMRRLNHKTMWRFPQKS